MDITAMTTSLVTYPSLPGGGTISLVNGAGIQSRQLDALASNVRTLYNVSRSAGKTQLNAMRQELKSASNLYNNANALSKAVNNQDAAKTLKNITGVINVYNKIMTSAQGKTDASASNQSLSANLLAIMQTTQDDLSKVGIYQDANTGLWTVDQNKFTAAASDSKSAERTFSIVGELASDFKQAAKSSMEDTTANYLKSTAPWPPGAYTLNLNNRNSNSYNMGIMLDLMA